MSIVNSTAVKLNDARKFIKSNISLQMRQKAAARLYMVGAPGCGKSDLMREICQENGWGLAVRYISNMAIEQLTGLPVKPEEGKPTLWSCPEIFNFSNMEYIPDNYQPGVTPTVLLLDDFHLCDRMMQKYMFQLLTYMGLNGYKLPANTAIILAGNRNNDKAGAMPIPAPVCNRIMFVEVTSEADDWLNNFAIKNEIRNDICTFISVNGDVYLSSEPIETNSWASPRSWTYLSYQMDQYEKDYGKIDLNDLRIMATGLLGNEVTENFIMYRELFSKWNFEALIKENWASVKKKYASAASNSTAIYAIINAGISCILDMYKKCDYDSENQKLKDMITFVYNTLGYLLIMKTGSVDTKALVAAGTQYLISYQNVMKSTTKAGKNFKNITELFLNEMMKERDADWLFFKILNNVMNSPIDKEDMKKIEKAEANVKAGKADI